MFREASRMGFAIMETTLTLFLGLLQIPDMIEKNEMHKANLERKRTLNQNSRSIMRSRDILNEARLQKIELHNLVIAERKARLEEIKARTRLYLAREAQMTAMYGVNSNPDQDFAGSVVAHCANCNNTQSRHLSDTCVNCGGDLVDVSLEI